MDRDGQLDHAQPGAEVAAGHADGGDRFLPQFIGQLAQLFGAQRAEIGRRSDGVEQGCFGGIGHPTGIAERYQHVDCRFLRLTAQTPPGEAAAMLSHRLATPDDIPAIAAVMDRAITELQRDHLSPAAIVASRAAMGLDTQLIDDGSYFVVHAADGQLAGCGG
ncbi:hypothetical protein LTR94_032591, partial [Friedmanniomyces endolithicus]